MENHLPRICLLLRSDPRHQELNNIFYKTLSSHAKSHNSIEFLKKTLKCIFKLKKIFISEQALSVKRKHNYSFKGF